MQKSAVAAGAATAGVVAASSLLSPTKLRGQSEGVSDPGLAPGQSDIDYKPVVTPNNPKLTWKLVDGVKVFHLIAEEVNHQFAPGLMAKCWGYNGSVHGPTIEAVEGDRVRFYVTNRLPEPTTVHWHGIILPNGMDGVGGLTQRIIQPGETYKYEFTLRQHGTFMYHPHHDEMTQMALGMMGLFIIHPRGIQQAPDRDFAIMLSEWKIAPGTLRPDSTEMTEFNVLTMNAAAYPGTDSLVVRQGERARIRFGNLGAMDHHPIHLHGYSFRVVETDGCQIAEPAQQREATVLVPAGSTRAIEFVADAPGDWALHCHMTHHVMNQMGHDSLNLIGVNTDKIDDTVRSTLIPGFMSMGGDGMGDMGGMGMEIPKNSISMAGGQGQYGPITMGGMFTILKVRPDITSYDDPGWYKHPAGTLASLAKAEELRRDGISEDKASS